MLPDYIFQTAVIGDPRKNRRKKHNYQKGKGDCVGVQYRVFNGEAEKTDHIAAKYSFCCTTVKNGKYGCGNNQVVY